MPPETKRRVGLGLGLGASTLAGAAIGAQAAATAHGFGDVAERVGIPFALLLAVLIALVIAGRWLADHVVKPIVVSHLNFVGSAITAQQQQAVVLERMELRHRTHQETVERTLEGIRQAIHIGARPPTGVAT
ncbi:MAG: hypothetical protein M9894_16210 [Planctomycetes bacterium]|nr:hypothetical protein [Planctomycetota bacterium]